MAEEAAVSPVQDCLDLLYAFTDDLFRIMADETSEWVSEFQTGLGQFTIQPPRN